MKDQQTKPQQMQLVMRILYITSTVMASIGGMIWGDVGGLATTIGLDEQSRAIAGGVLLVVSVSEILVVMPILKKAMMKK